MTSAARAFAGRERDMNLQRAFDEIVRGLYSAPARLVGGIALLRRDAEIVRAFREAGAVTPARAQRFHPHSGLDEVAFNRLLSMGVIRQASRGRYYLADRDADRRSVSWEDLFDPDPLD